MRGPTLPFAPTKTYGLIFVDLREKRREKIYIFLCLHALSIPPLVFSFFFFFYFYVFFLIIIIWIHGSYCLIRVYFCPETIYLFLVHFILNELSSSHFLTFEIFIKILSLKSLATYHPENRKNIPTVSEFDETFMGH